MKGNECCGGIFGGKDIYRADRGFLVSGRKDTWLDERVKGCTRGGNDIDSNAYGSSSS